MADRTAVCDENPHEEGARRALLERLASGIAVIADAREYTWTCCWLSYSGPFGARWAWQTCGGQMPGDLPRDATGRHIKCGHWHHRAEAFMAQG